MVKLTIVVSDIDTVYSAGFRYILIYRSDSYDGTYTYLDNVSLKPSVTSYEYVDTEGTDRNWYKSRYANSVPPPEPTLLSSFSDPVRGESVLYHNVTYPSEISLSDSEETIVKKVRHLIGDSKKLDRDYVASCYTNVQPDGYTYVLENRGWPVYISLNNVEKTSLEDPYVDGYRFLKFAEQISTVTGTLDIYYYSFRWSDREILDFYNNCLIPPGLTSTTVTSDHLVLQTAIDLLESENWDDYISDGARIRDDTSTYDPTPGFRAREAAIARLKKKLDDLVNQFLLLGIDGVRIE